MWSAENPNDWGLSIQDPNNTRVEVKVEADTRRQHKQTFYIKVELVAFATEA